jgi:drug/metabolite transporter (DMT)-like permease
LRDCVFVEESNARGYKRLRWPTVCTHLPSTSPRSGDFVYQATEVMTLGLVLGLIAAVGFVFRRSYSERADKFGSFLPQVPSALGALWLILPALVIAVLLHPSLNNNFITDTAWAFALYLEAVAIVPQLFMLTNTAGAEVEPFEGG